MANDKVLVNPPFYIDPYFGLDKYDKMRKKAMDKCAIQRNSMFFQPGILNIFTDAAMKRGTNIATIANAVVTSSPYYGTTTVLSNVNYIDADNTLEAELDSILYGLICYNSTIGGGNLVNIFTDSIGSVSKLRDIFANMNLLYGDQNEMINYSEGLNKEGTTNELLYMVASERTLIQNPVNIYHIKAHSKDIMMIRTMFSQMNGINISVRDAIELTNYSGIIDSSVNKYVRCPETFDK